MRLMAQMWPVARGTKLPQISAMERAGVERSIPQSSPSFEPSKQPTQDLGEKDSKYRRSRWKCGTVPDQPTNGVP
jgi:hypothetical protein